MADWTGTPDGEGTYSFLVGPLEIHESDANTNLVVALGDGLDHWSTVDIDYTSCEEEPEEEPAPPRTDPCESVGLQADAQQDGVLRVEATDLASEASLMRAEGGSALEEVATMDADSSVFVDSETNVGTTYVYRLVIDDEVCGSVEVAAIPVFPTALAGASAMAASALGYALLRRRR